MGGGRHMGDEEVTWTPYRAQTEETEWVFRRGLIQILPPDYMLERHKTCSVGFGSWWLGYLLHSRSNK